MKRKFPIGRVLATPAAMEAMDESGQQPAFFLDQHCCGNWGNVCPEDERANDDALVTGCRLLSAYRTLLGTWLWIITEADRAATTILLPEEY